MNREQVIAKWNGRAPRERDAWVADVVFGWSADDIDDAMDAWKHGVCGVCQFPYYTTDISAAWAVLEKTDVWALYPTSDSYNVEYSLGHEIVNAPTAPEAICLAAIIAKLTDSES